MGVSPRNSSKSLFLITDPFYRKCSCPIHYKQVDKKYFWNTLFGQGTKSNPYNRSSKPYPRQEHAGEENIRDPVLTHHNVTLTHGRRELLPGSLSVSLCNQSRRHCPKSRGVTFCCRAEFKAERQTDGPATPPEPGRERYRGPHCHLFYFEEQAMSSASTSFLHVGCGLTVSRS